MAGEWLVCGWCAAEVSGYAAGEQVCDVAGNFCGAETFCRATGVVMVWQGTSGPEGCGAAEVSGYAVGASAG